MGDTNPDLDGTHCCVADCYSTADGMGTARITVPAEVGAVEDAFTLELPLCGDHVHLFRQGAETIDLDSGA